MVLANNTGGSDVKLTESFLNTTNICQNEE